MATRLRGHVLTVVAATLVAATFVAALLNANGTITLGGSYEVKAMLPTAVSLTPGARVTMAGVEVGRVRSVQRAGVGAIATLKLTDDRVTPVPVDTRAAVRLHTAVGENYIALSPGRARRTLPSGGSLPVSQADDYVDVDEVLSVLRGETRQRARELFQASGNALRGRGQSLNDVLRRLAGTYRPGSDLVRSVAREHAHIARVVDNLGRLGSGLAERGDAIGRTARRVTSAFGAIAARDAALRSGLRQLPDVLASAQRASGALSTVTRRATPTITELSATLGDLRPGLRALRPAADEGRRVVTELATATPSLRGVLRRVRTLAPGAAQALPQLHKTLCQLNPAVAHVAPYIQDVVATISSFGSSMNAYDALGHIIRVTPLVGDNSLVGAPEPVSRALKALLHNGVFQETRGLGYNPYPKPGRAGQPDGLGALGPSEVKQEYPRVKAAC